jgi:two-component system NtrC family response regulator
MTKFILVYTHPTEGEKRIELASGRSYRIGSRADNDIVIDQKDVSRRHAVLRVQDGSFHITDLDSKNGTFINGAKVDSETFTCGDMVHLSSARLVIVEIGTGSYPAGPEVITREDEEYGVAGIEETQKYRSEASMEDVVSLLEKTASAVHRGALAEPLTWAVEHLGFDGAVVLYRDADDGVAMVSSAGDLGQLARKSGVLSKLAIEHRLTSVAGTRVRQVRELDEKLLLATVGSDHVLVVRYAGRPPAIGDLRSLIAAVTAVLGSGRVLGKGEAEGGRDRASTASPVRMVGLSEAMLTCRLAAAEAAEGTAPIVIFGERGAGTSLVSRWVHDLSPRSSSPFVVIDLDGASASLIEKRLLTTGEVLSGADHAEGGTVVLDHVADLPPDTWDTILGAVADSSGQAPRMTLILNQDYAPGDGESLTGSIVSVPGLKQRRGDIPILVSNLLRAEGGVGTTRPVAFTRAVMKAMSAYDWPGNVVELQLEVRKAVAAASPGHLVEIEHLSRALAAAGKGDDAPDLDLEGLVELELAEARNEFEAWLVRRVLAASGGSQTEAARRLGLSRAGLFKKMRKLDI